MNDVPIMVINGTSMTNMDGAYRIFARRAQEFNAPPYNFDYIKALLLERGINSVPVGLDVYMSIADLETIALPHLAQQRQKTRSSPTEDDRVKALALAQQQGVTLKQIAEQFGLPRSRIERWIADADVETRQAIQRANPRVRNRTSRKYSADLKAEVRQRYLAMEPLDTICQELHILPAAAKKMVQDLRPAVSAARREQHEAAIAQLTTTVREMRASGATLKHIAQAVGHDTRMVWSLLPPESRGNHRRYSDDLKKLALQRLAQGELESDVALDLEINPGTLRTWRLSMEPGENKWQRASQEMKEQAHQLRERGATLADIGQTLGYDPSTISTWLAEDRRKPRYSPEDRDAVLQRYHQGESVESLASSTGIAASTISRWLRSTELARSRGRPRQQ